MPAGLNGGSERSPNASAFQPRPNTVRQDARSAQNARAAQRGALA